MVLPLLAAAAEAALLRAASSAPFFDVYVDQFNVLEEHFRECVEHALERFVVGQNVFLGWGLWQYEFLKCLIQRFEQIVHAKHLNDVVLGQVAV